MARYTKGDRVRVIDPADKRRRVNGLIIEVSDGRGALEYKVILDDMPGMRIGISDNEITRKV